MSICEVECMWRYLFATTGAFAYVTTESGIDVIGTATSSVIRVIGDRQGPQGIAVSPDGRILYVTNPNAGTLWELNAATGALLGSTPAGAEPYAVTVTPNGSALYVADMNSDSVSVISAATGKATGTIGVGRLPMSIGGPGTATLDAAPLGISFVAVSS